MLTRRFEFADEQSRKFWEITVTGTTVTVTYGRIGANGQTQIKEHATATDAKAAAEKQVAEKVKKGYRESDATAAAKPAAKTSAEAAARTAPATTAGSRKGSASSGGVDAQALAAIWTLLAQHDLASQQQGIALLRALDDPALWASLAEGLSLAEDGRLVIPEGCEVHTRVSGGASSRHGELLALWALRQEGRLAGVAQLDLQGCKYLTDLTPLAGLTDLRTLNLSGCEALTDLTELSGLTGLHELDLSGCTALTDLTPLAGMTGLRTLDLHGCAALTDLTPLAGLTSCFPKVLSRGLLHRHLTGQDDRSVLEFEVYVDFYADLWHDVKAGPWRVRIPGFEASDDGRQLILPLSRPILDSLRECLDAEAAREEGLLNLNVLLTVNGKDDYELIASRRGEQRWFFDRLELYFEEQRVLTWSTGPDTAGFYTYDIDAPMPQQWFWVWDNSVAIDDGKMFQRNGVWFHPVFGRLEDAPAMAITASDGSLEVLAELIEKVRALREAQEEGDNLYEDGRANTPDICIAKRLIVHPTRWGMIITEHDSWGRIGRGEAPEWKEVSREATLLEEIGILLESVGSAEAWASDQKSLSSVVLSARVSKEDDAKKRKWTAAERKRRLQLARTVVEQFSAAASETLDAEEIYLFMGNRDGESDAPDYLTLNPSDCRPGSGRWWKVEDALNTLLDASSKACLDAIDEHFFGDEEIVTMGIRTTLPFIASHRGCAISEVLDEAELGQDFRFDYVDILPGSDLLHRQRYIQGEFESGALGLLAILDRGLSWERDRESVKSVFSDEGWNDLVVNPSSPDSPYDARRLLQLLSEAAAQADA